MACHEHHDGRCEWKPLRRTGIGQRLKRLVCVALIGQQFVGRLTPLFGISAINTFCGDREPASLSPSDPALLSEIPKMKFQMLGRTASQALQFEVVDAGVADVLSALYI